MVRLLWYLTPPAPVMWQEMLQLEVDEAWEFSHTHMAGVPYNFENVSPRYPLT